MVEPVQDPGYRKEQEEQWSTEFSQVPAGARLWVPELQIRTRSFAGVLLHFLLNRNTCLVLLFAQKVQRGSIIEPHI